MKVSPYVDGIIKGVVMPEKRWKNRLSYGEIIPPFWIEEYQTALERAKAEALPFEDQEEATSKLIHGPAENYAFYTDSREPQGLREGFFDPSIVWEVTEIEQRRLRSKDVCVENGWTPERPYKKGEPHPNPYMRRKAYRLVLSS